MSSAETPISFALSVSEISPPQQVSMPVGVEHGDRRWNAAYDLVDGE
jgi:hypothetical protein